MRKDIPKVGQTYNCFDDGKISPGRLYTVEVKKVVSFKKIDKRIKKQWKQEVRRCYWLYAKKTDYFIITESDEEVEVFVRTIDDGWFSIGDFLNGGRLDVDGKLTEILNGILINIE